MLARTLTLLQEQEVGKPPPKILLFGPSGCGKTFVAKWWAGELSKDNPVFFPVIPKPTGLLRGNVLDNVDRLFQGLELANELILDDIEILVADLVSDPKAFRYFLRKLEVLRGVLVVATTKYPRNLHRDLLSTFDVFLPILYPKEKDRRDILGIYYKNRAINTSDDAILDQLARRTQWFSSHELVQLVQQTFSAKPAYSIKLDDFEQPLEQLRKAFDIEKRRDEIEEYLEFTFGNPKVPVNLQEDVRECGIEFGVINGHLLIRQRPVLEFLSTVTDIKIKDYTIAGYYARFDPELITRLRKIVTNVRTIIKDSHWKDYNNFLIHGVSGSGKTEFVRQLAKELESLKVEPYVFKVSDIASETEYEKKLKVCHQLLTAGKSVLLFIDEIDVLESKSWNVEVLLGPLEWNQKDGEHIICFLAGSKGKNLEEFSSILDRIAGDKRVDFQRRIHSWNRIQIPPISYQDKIIITIALTRLKGMEVNRSIKLISKAALAAIALRADINDAGAIYSIVSSAVQRISEHEDKLKYEHLFEPDDEAKYKLYQEFPTIFGTLMPDYVNIID